MEQKFKLKISFKSDLFIKRDEKQSIVNNNKIIMQKYLNDE